MATEVNVDTIVQRSLHMLLKPFQLSWRCGEILMTFETVAQRPSLGQEGSARDS